MCSAIVWRLSLLQAAGRQRRERQGVAVRCRRCVGNPMWETRTLPGCLPIHINDYLAVPLHVAIEGKPLAFASEISVVPS